MSHSPAPQHPPTRGLEGSEAIDPQYEQKRRALSRKGKIALIAGGTVAFLGAILFALFFFTGPVVTHALAQACLHAGIRPMLAEDRREARRLPIASGDDGRRP